MGGAEEEAEVGGAEEEAAVGGAEEVDAGVGVEEAVAVTTETVETGTETAATTGTRHLPSTAQSSQCSMRLVDSSGSIERWETVRALWRLECHKQTNKKCFF